MGGGNNLSLAKKLDKAFSNVLQAPQEETLTTVESSMATTRVYDNARMKQKMQQKLIEDVKELEARIKQRRAQIGVMAKEN